ncbi:MAG: toll/interleukin-1 receptor domain-containing protein, partial [Chloroflexi bacterium]|nr:toll/interleukin-1 receptor domain-containing protein [Chloroflexota bacterium]
MTDSTQDDLTSREVSTSNVNGGVQADTQGGDLNVSGDVVGRDKLVSAGTYIERVEVHVHGGVPAESIEFPLRSNKPARLFISYKRNAEPDQKLAQALYESLQRGGHQVFMDVTMRTGDAWLEEIDRQLKGSDFLIVLLSQQSADSEMVRAEVSRAYEYRKLQERPQTLPVRVAYQGLLPYSLDAFLNPLQYVVWQNDNDTARVCDEIQQAIAGKLPDQTPIRIRLGPDRLAVSDDGRVITNDAAFQPPLPEFDPRFLKQLEVPGGAVKLSDKLYVEREADGRLKAELTKWGATTTIRAPRQTGKTSLLTRGMQHVRSQGQAVVFFDVQSSGRERLASSEIFLRGMAEAISDELALDEALLEQAWQGTRGASVKLQRFLEKQVLPGLDKPLVLAIDEADGLLQSDFYTDFFGLLRSWHNRRATNPEWEKFNLVLVISTEPYLLIADMNQSPFNVGLHLGLSDFTIEQVRDLNVR